MELDNDQLLALLPAGAALCVLARSVLGIRTVGTFAPALVALAMLDSGVVTITAMLAVAGAAGIAASPLVDRLALPRSSRLGAIVVVVCASLAAVDTGSDEGGALPLVVVAIVIERLWETTQTEGPRRAVSLGGATVATAVVVAVALQTLTPLLTGHSVFVSALIGLGITVAAGSYRGLRLTERRRFAGLLQGASPSRPQPALERVM